MQRHNYTDPATGRVLARAQAGAHHTGVLTVDSVRDLRALATTRATLHTNRMTQDESTMADVLRGRVTPFQRDWLGGLNSLPALDALLVDGWSDGARRMRDLSAGLEVPTPQARRRRTRWSSEDGELDVDRALAGAWDVAYRERRRVLTATPQVLRVGCVVGGSAIVDADNLTWSGVQGVALTDALEAAGYRVELAAVFVEEDLSTSARGSRRYGVGNGEAVVTVGVKQADEPLRADHCAAVLAHAGVFRTLMLNAVRLNTIPVLDGTGRPVHGESDMAAVLDVIQANGCEVPAYDILLPAAYTRESASAHICTALAAIGGAA